MDRMIAEFLLEMILGGVKPRFDGVKFNEFSKVIGEAVMEEDSHKLGAVEIAPVIYDDSKTDPVVRTNVLEGENDKKSKK